MRELKLLVDHRDCLVAERTRAAAAVALASARARPALPCSRRWARPDRLARPARPPVRPRRADDADRDRAGARRPLPDADPHDPRDRARSRDADDGAGAWFAGAARLWPRDDGEAARRDRPDRPLPLRRANSPATPASHRSRPAAANTDATDSTAAATANSTAHSTRSRSPRPGSTHPHAPTWNANRPKARRREALRCLKRHLARTIHTTLKNEPPLT